MAVFSRTPFQNDTRVYSQPAFCIGSKQLTDIGCMPLRRKDLPKEIFSIRELEPPEDLFVECLSRDWVRLGAWRRRQGPAGIHGELWRQSVLIPSDGFSKAFNALTQIGNVMMHMGSPHAVQRKSFGKSEYAYNPSHEFQFYGADLVGEPLVFTHEYTTHVELLINPDLWLYLKLEERPSGSGIWRDPKTAEEALRRRYLSDEGLEIVDIGAKYLRRYLKIRQMALLIGHYQQLLLINPDAFALKKFRQRTFSSGSVQRGVKAIFENWGPRDDGRGTYLQRRMHLWMETKPDPLDLAHPFDDPPPINVYRYTLTTKEGPVPPARFLQFEPKHRFLGRQGEFLDRVYFRQEVLTKYENDSSFKVGDDGSIRCYFWSLCRSVSRIGNELLSTGVGDFGQEVPFEEWSHWKHYAVPPPSDAEIQTVLSEVALPEAVNAVVRSLKRLNRSFSELASAFSKPPSTDLWHGTSESLAERQLKRVYLPTAGDEEFLKRANFASTLFLDALRPSPLRELLRHIHKTLHLKFGSGDSLASRKLLERLSLATVIIRELQPKLDELPKLIEIAEARTNDSDPLSEELRKLNNRNLADLSALAYLYDLRNIGGMAHQSDPKAAGDIAEKLGLPRQDWHRRDYLQLLKQIDTSIGLVADNFDRLVLMQFPV